jgi:hypothetical protein
MPESKDTTLKLLPYRCLGADEQSDPNSEYD